MAENNGIVSYDGLKEYTDKLKIKLAGKADAVFATTDDIDAMFDEATGTGSYMPYATISDIDDMFTSLGK